MWSHRYKKKDTKILKASLLLKSLQEKCFVTTRRRRHNGSSSFVPASQQAPKNKRVKYAYDLTFSDSDD